MKLGSSSERPTGRERARKKMVRRDLRPVSRRAGSRGKEPHEAVTGVDWLIGTPQAHGGIRGERGADPGVLVRS